MVCRIRTKYGVGHGFYCIDLSQSWDLKKTSYQYKFLLTIGPKEIPTDRVVGGALSHDPTNPSGVSLYGGAPLEFNDANNTFVSTTPVSDLLWSFDTISRSWSFSNVSTLGLNVSRHSASAEVAAKDLLFYLDGANLVVLNTVARTARHITLPAKVSRIGANLQYIASLGSKGILILIGGDPGPDNQTTGAKDRKMVRHTRTILEKENSFF